MQDAKTLEVKLYRKRVRQLIKRSGYSAAERFIAAAVTKVGVSSANWLYQPLWEHAMAKGNHRATARFLRAQSEHDWENHIGETARRQQLTAAENPPATAAQQLDTLLLAKLAKSKPLARSWDGWQQAIALVEDFLHGYAPGQVAQNFSQVQTTSSRHILVAGSGRSGSSAVFDWLSGFDEIRGTRQQHFYMRDMLNIVQLEPNSSAFRKRLVNILWQTFLGRFVYTSKSQYRKSQLARFMVRKHGHSLASTACLVLTKLINISNGDAFSTSRSRPASRLESLPHFLNCFASLFSTTHQRFAATGWLDFDAAYCFPYLSNCFIICATRDPRDVYTEHLALTRTFDGNLRNFIDTYRAKMAILESSLASNTNNIIPIKFEVFVRSMAARDELCTRLGLDKAQTWRPDPRFPFQAEQSQKNVGVHRSCPDQNAIRTIERDLADYCED